MLWDALTALYSHIRAVPVPAYHVRTSIVFNTLLNNYGCLCMNRAAPPHTLTVRVRVPRTPHSCRPTDAASAARWRRTRSNKTHLIVSAVPHARTHARTPHARSTAPQRPTQHRGSRNLWCTGPGGRATACDRPKAHQRMCPRTCALACGERARAHARIFVHVIRY